MYISPSFRANSIWPESAILGLLFFVISIYYFLKFKKKKEIKFALLNVLFLAFSAYIRPSFCLFAAFYFLQFVNYYLKIDKIKILYILVLNLTLAFPAFYYVFILDVFFIDYGGLSSNYFNKTLIISSIIIFHMLPLLFYSKIFSDLDLKKNIFFILIITVCFIFFLQNF